MILVHDLHLHSLPPQQLHTPCDPAAFPFQDTAALPQPEFPFGQQRAIEALQLGLETRGRGYNIFVLGRPGSGRHASVRRRLEAHALTLPPPGDCCYVHNFADPQKPRVLTLPPGEGARLRAGMQGFVSELGKAVQSAFEGEEYRARIEAIQKDYKRREDAALQALGQRAVARHVVLVRSPEGFSFAPLKDDEPLGPQAFEALPQAERERIAGDIRELTEELMDWMQQLPRLRREMQARMTEASRDTLKLAAGHLIEELKESFAAHAQVQQLLQQVLDDIIESGEQFRTELHGDDEVAELTGSLPLARYQVNLLVGHASDGHAPVASCDNPTYPQLVGRVDHVAHMGTLLTNFTMIRAGALQRANGGFLLLDAVEVLSRPYSWEALKRALSGGRVLIETLPEVLGLGSATPALEPDAVPLSLKVVLFGERQHYYLLQALDPEFDRLFRVAVDFEDDVPRTGETVASFAAFVGAMARLQQLRPCDASAVARLVDHAARMAGHAGRLSTHASLLEELLHEADTHAARAGSAVVTRSHVEAALADREQRSDRLRDRLREQVLEDTLVIPTTGTQVGQLNGLAVTDLVDFSFGHPLRITATARLGEDKVVDIERESALGQPLHSKGVLILSSYLGARYAPSTPLSLSASLVFEQSYGPVEGDSASLAELCTLLSALGRVPLRQGLAVTGSVDQFGRVQAIGGVNEKIEGFFDICRARGLTGEQGVLIPSANVPHLILRHDVVQAVAEGRFHVCAVSDVDEALALLSGLSAGSVDASGRWTPDSFNERVAVRLEQLSLARQTFGTGQRTRLRKPRRHPGPPLHGRSSGGE